MRPGPRVPQTRTRRPQDSRPPLHAIAVPCDRARITECGARYQSWHTVVLPCCCCACVPQVSGLTFAAYAEKALNTTQACLDRAALFEAAAGARSASGSGSGATGGADRLRGDSSSSGSSGSGGSGSGGSGSGARFAGYGMDMTLSEWMRMQCFQANRCVVRQVHTVFPLVASALIPPPTRAQWPVGTNRQPVSALRTSLSPHRMTPSPPPATALASVPS